MHSVAGSCAVAISSAMCLCSGTRVRSSSAGSSLPMVSNMRADA
eukprot:CAMPEP_0177674136 /NCGR_PEP_ID=MMETSP0447-20121125/26371_1 /TAXON_ID=0 /ORGANISM="Stygamoeba regulata, Strain BSH-02190019" /LENGTH=43 /DNA_ID= /DNA_START= /DNA_END= /DNA_ORIENTATION=